MHQYFLFLLTFVGFFCYMSNDIDILRYYPHQQQHHQRSTIHPTNKCCMRLTKCKEVDGMAHFVGISTEPNQLTIYINLPLVLVTPPPSYWEFSHLPPPKLCVRNFYSAAFIILKKILTCHALFGLKKSVTIIYRIYTIIYTTHTCFYCIHKELDTVYH